jgi:hypothetical protein
VNLEDSFYRILNYAGPTPLFVNLIESLTLIPPSSENYNLIVVFETSILTVSTFAVTIISKECFSFNR